MGKLKEIEYKGKKYSGVSVLAESVGMPARLLYTRLNSGWSVEAAVETPVSEQRLGRKLEHNGVVYKSVRELADDIGMSYGTLRSRLQMGWSVQDAVERDVRKFGIEYDGKVYDSVAKLANSVGLDKSVVESRLRAGWTLDEAIHGRERKKVMYKGVEYNSVKDLCRIHGLNYGVVGNRIRNGWSLDDAVETEEGRGRLADSVDYDGKTYTSIAELCRELNLPYSSVCSDYKQGLTIAEIVEKRSKSMDTSIEYRGVWYKSLSALCRELGLTYATVQGRLSKGWTIEQAVETKVLKAKLVGPVTVYGKTFKSVVRACKYAGVGSMTVEQRVSDGMSLQEAIELGPSKNTYEYDRRKFSSLKGLAEYTGGSVSLIGKRLRAGHSVKDACDYARSVSTEGKTAFMSISKLRDVKCVKSYLHGRFALITCAVCGRDVMLPVRDAKSFVHSDVCIKYMWGS